MRRLHAVLPVALILGVALMYNSCRSPLRPNAGFAPVKTNDTITGNPMDLPATKVADAACSILRQAHTGLTAESCADGVFSTSFSEVVGVPEDILNPYWHLAKAEADRAVSANLGLLDGCLAAIRALDPSLGAVRAAYNPSQFNAFSGVAAMVAAAGSACAELYRDNTFVPEIPPPPPERITVVRFDDPDPGPDDTTKLLNGIHGGIDFGRGFWGWEKPYYAATSNFAYNLPSTTGDTGFAFSGGPKTLVSLKVFSQKAGQSITVYDELGQSVSLNIPADRNMHTVTTGFTRPSSHIYFRVLPTETYNGVGIDDVTYLSPEVPPRLAHVQTVYALWDRTNSQSRIHFNSPNTEGNLIVAQVNWDSGNLSSVTDAASNTYTAATEVTVSPDGSRQQIWYAKNIAGGANQVMASFSGSRSLSGLVVHEYSGADRQSPLDRSVSRAGTGYVADSGDVTISTADQLLYAGVQGDDGRPMSYTEGYTVRPMDGGMDCADRVVSAQGSYRVQARMPMNSGWILQFVTFKAAH
jgi:hypothetical protein